MQSDRGRNGPQPISRILDDALRKLGLQERLQERSVLSLWREVVGEKIAAHSRAVDISDGVLILEADHGVWRQEITMLMPTILEKFQTACGPDVVQEIRWKNQPARSNKHRQGKP